MYRLPFKSSLGPPAEAGAQREKPAPHSINRFAAGAFARAARGAPSCWEQQMKALDTLARTTREQGLRAASVKVFTRAIGAKEGIPAAKEKVLKHLLRLHGERVAYGRFKGLKIRKDVWWGRYSLSSKILGVYEEHVLDALFDLQPSVNGPFVDIGAADGYFAIGAVVSGLCDTVYAYEISEKGRERLASNAAANGCAGKVRIEAEANFESLSALMKKHEQALLLIDIEGCEFDLLDERMLDLLKSCSLIVELHPWMAENGYEKQRRLIDMAKAKFNARLIEREVYAPNQFEELKEFSDDERLLALSEGREKNMQWLVMTPKMS